MINIYVIDIKIFLEYFTGILNGNVKVNVSICLIDQAPLHEDIGELRCNSTILDLGNRGK
jgi:hypothetical protein